MTPKISARLRWTAALLSAPSIALAADGDFQAVSILTKLITLLNSDIARVIFVLSIVGIGYGWLYLGRIPQGKAVGAIIGIGIVFSAGFIANQLGVGIQ